MIFPYTVDKNIFDFHEGEFESWSKDISGFNDMIQKNSIWIDCESDVMNKAIYDKVMNCNNGIKPALFELWKKYYWGKNLNIRKNCVCEKSSECSIDTVTETVCQYYKNIEFCHTNDDSIQDVESISVKRYQDSNVYKNCRDYSEISVGPFSNSNNGTDFMINHWGWAFKLVNKITIIDKIAFKCWKQNYNNSDYKKGLDQFCEIAQKLNSNLKIRIITELGSSSGGSKEENYEALSNHISSINEPKLEVCLVERSDIFRHDRYILFNKAFGAYISTGLKNFIPNSNTNSITYHNYNLVEQHIAVANHDIIEISPFNPIRNY